MSKIILGTHSGANVGFDLDLLLATRLLIQAGSGGGKSWALRRLMEQAFGKVQIICIDPEGEFSTLREKYDFVLAGKGGEATVDPRAAGLLAERLLQLKASAVCDIYELKSHQRHAFVKNFLEALINAPKELWHPVLVIVDEAHVFCPEKGQGESEAYSAMTDLATRGRKRGFAAIFATQRLGKLSKNASAELTNRLIGPTFEDVDRKRAAELLGIAKADEREFSRELQVATPGTFHALGRAISLERVKVQVGPVLTSHPEVGKGKLTQHEPPTPEAIKAMLPQLADLPREAEEKTRTVAELNQAIANLKRELTNSQKAAPQVDVNAFVKERIIKGELYTASAIKEALRLKDDLWTKAAGEYTKRITEAIRAVSFTKPEPLALETIAVGNLRITLPPAPVGVVRRDIYASPKDSPRPMVKLGSVPGNSEITGPMQRILDAIAWFESIGIMEPKQVAVAFLAGYAVDGGGYCNPRGALRVAGLVEYRGDGLALTNEGRRLARTPESPLDTQELHRKVLGKLPGPEQKILSVLLQAYPSAVTNEEVAGKAGYEPDGGGYCNPRGRLRTLGLVDYPQKGMVRAADLLFI